MDGFHVAYGESDLVTAYERNQYAEVEAVYKHPNYDDNDRYNLNDIALVKLARPLKFTKAVQPACLPAQPQDHYDGVLKVRPIIFTCLSKFQILKLNFIFGDVQQWVAGIYDDGPGLSRYLKEGNTYDLSDDPGVNRRSKYHICVENRKDSSVDITCNGDSGEQRNGLHIL